MRENERYLLDRESVAVDLDQFERLLTRASGTRRREQLLEAHSSAASRWRAPTTRGRPVRCAASATIVDLLEELGNLRLESGNPTGALAAAEQALSLDPHNEAAHRVAMHAEAALGLRQAIVVGTNGLRQELDQRFGLEPEHETRRLYRRLLSQDARSHARGESNVNCGYQLSNGIPVEGLI